MAGAGVVATLLPNAAFYLKLGRFAPARKLIEAGVPVALATDVNPGGGFSPSMPFAIALACFAHEHDVRGSAGGCDGQRRVVARRAPTDVGSLEAGKLADAVHRPRRGDQPDSHRRAVDRRPSSSAAAWSANQLELLDNCTRQVIR